MINIINWILCDYPINLNQLGVISLLTKPPFVIFLLSVTKFLHGVVSNFFIEYQSL